MRHRLLSDHFARSTDPFKRCGSGVVKRSGSIRIGKQDAAVCVAISNGRGSASAAAKMPGVSYADLYSDAEQRPADGQKAQEDL